LLTAAAGELGLGGLVATVRGIFRLSRGGQETNLATRDPDVRGGAVAKVNTITGPPNSIVRGQGAHVFRINDKGQVIEDITKGRVNPVTPGQGFGPKRLPTERELGWLERMAQAVRELLK
jgi:hypothetical protein